MNIMALDLGDVGKRSVGVMFLGSGRYRRMNVPTREKELVELVARWRPERVVLEGCAISGWAHDVLEAAGADACVVVPEWLGGRNKSDELDAQKLLERALLGRVREIYVPGAEVRAWRSVIQYRHRLIQKRTRIKNGIRSLVKSQGIEFRGRGSAWSDTGVEILRRLSRESTSSLFCIQLGWRLQELEEVQGHIQRVEQALEHESGRYPAVGLLRQEVGIGPRFAEAFVAAIVDPLRFRNAKQVSAYLGLTPRRWQSGQVDRLGSISRAGNGTVRAILLQATWASVRCNLQVRADYRRLLHGQPARKLKAVTGAARKVAVRLWALWRDAVLTGQLSRTCS